MQGDCAILCGALWSKVGGSGERGSISLLRSSPVVRVKRMFLGEYNYTIDDKGRLIIPAKFRQPLMSGLVVTRGLDRNLAIYPLDEWMTLVEKINQLPYGDPAARTLRRLVFSGASDVEPDGQGRVNIPAYLLDYGRISKDVIVAGMNTYIEVWSPEEWQSVRAVLEDGTNASRWASLGI